MRLVLALDAVEFAGAERYVEVLLEGLTSYDVDALVLLPAGAEPQLAERLSVHAEVSPVPGLRRRPAAAASRAVRAAVRRWRADLVHLNLTDQGDGLGLVAASLGSRIPLVMTLHNAIPGRASGRETLSGAVLRRAAQVLAPSAAVADYAQARGASATVVWNGLAPVDRHPDPRRALGLPAPAEVVGGVGRLHPQKGWDLLAPVAAQLRERRPGARVVVVGEGPERARLEASAAPGLELLGGRADAAALMAAFDVLVVPSRYEAFGLVAVEAMHAAVPVVATAVGGLPEVVADAGVLVPQGDPARLLAALEELLDDPARRRQLGERGRARARALFTPDAMVARTWQVYRGLVRP